MFFQLRALRSPNRDAPPQLRFDGTLKPFRPKCPLLLKVGADLVNVYGVQRFPNQRPIT